MKKNMIMQVEEINKILETERKNFRVKYVKKWKINEMKEGFALFKSDQLASPIIYVNDEVMMMTTQELISYMEKILAESVKPDIETIMESIKSKEYIKANIYPSLLSLHENIKSFERENMFFIPVEDMAITFYILVKIGNDTGKIRIKNDMLKDFNLTKEEIYLYAKENLFQKHDILDIQELLNQELNDIDSSPAAPSKDSKMIIVTTKDRDEGAALMLNENIIKEVKRYFPSKFLIIPSSIHEFIAVEYQNQEEINMIRKMVHHINFTVISKSEYLSDNVFVWKNGGLHKA